ncbi:MULTISPECIES: hypothetical protein [Paenibacillus]|uniref:hypothetical protein n=1 Tax=Paenibacillus TaxID=44249 RepID=UPI00142DF109|nr:MULTISPECIES: hypothetical protein [Paenibacillus]KAF6615604.1 hypothetical protein HFE00_19945 [Paenibacillus sp. EKM101P]KAF6619970.1 hypothetical protein HFE03_18350 [Paenibacillus sp. EKM102P]KAF6628539.1 hypothetical protein HFE01_18410 [Paenibacillus sp. EKM10P]KAF6644439.1 hypothetical protein HFE02_19665 [Paenibacillus sp. EKM11P]WOZ37238.1 hypothetical protein RQP19_17965 [Paenibacillus polymyxa]
MLYRGTSRRKGSPHQRLHAETLRKISAAMLPFYKAIATRRAFAVQWSRAVVQGNLDRMKSLLCSVAPFAAKQGLGTNGIGYFVSFLAQPPMLYYTNGTTIPPGMVQFTFEPKVHRAIAKAVFPLYRELARNECFASALAKAIYRQDQRAVQVMIRSLIPSSALKSVDIEDNGFALLFKYPFSKYPYRNLLFQEFT